MQRETLVKFDPAVESQEEGGKTQQASWTARKKMALQGEQVPSKEDILNAILPPMEWSEEGRHFIQYVSQHQATRQDVAQLTAELDRRLQERQARDSGICPVREELYSQCFDELIRQVTLVEPAQGLLLLRVRDEIKMTIAAYQTLYQSSVTFGTRKQLQSEMGKSEMEERIQELEKRKARLINRKNELASRKEAIIRRNQERRQVEETKRKQEIDFLEYQGQHLDTFLKSMEK